MQHVCLVNSPSLHKRAVSRSMAGGLGFDSSEAMVLPPLDLAIMAATLRNAGYEVELIDADPMGLDDLDVYAQLVGREYAAIVASVSLPTLDNDSEFVAGLKQRHPEAQVFAKTLVRDQKVLKELLRQSGAHLVIHGEADLSIPRLITGETRDGTAWLEASGELVFEAGTPVSNLNELPFPARDLLPNERYIYPLLGSPVATLQTSRGCPFPCGYYCPYPLVEGTVWRAQSPERIVAELKEVVERWGIRKIYFRDATFTLNKERIAQLCNLIIAAGWHIEWLCETRVDCLTDELLETMKAAGCVGILIGVETGDENVMHRKEGKKGLTVAKLAHLREKTRELGLRLHFLLIVGLPQETRESAVATYDLVMRYDPDTIGVTIITPYPGTPLYDEGQREGWIDSHDWRDYGGHQVVMHTPHLSHADLVAAKHFIEGGFVLLQRERSEGKSPQLNQLKKQHYLELLSWAYALGEVKEQAREAGDIASRQLSGRRDDTLLSVIIPTYNREGILRKTLMAFASQTVEPEKFEVIVVDDGSTDHTLTMLKPLKTPFRLRVLSQQHRGANAARNLGIQHAQGRIVLITGDDMVPGPFLVEAHLKFHLRHEDACDAMLGFVDWSPEINVTPLMRHIVSPEGEQQFAFHRVRDGKADFRLFYTSNVSLKRSFLLEQDTLFDTDFSYPAYDDIELGYRLQSQGMRLHYRPQAVTYHHHDITTEGLVERQRHAGRMAVVFARKHPEIDKGLLDVADILASPNHPDEKTLQRWLDAVLELEKPDAKKLATLQMNNQTLDEAYARAVLYPHNMLLRTAYSVGVVEGMKAWEAGSASKGHRLGVKEFEVSIIIPAFNKVELTRQCLTTLAQITQGADYEVIVVDNGSTDDTPAFLSTLGGDVQIIRNEENLGFARACNQGARAAKGRYLVFLNNDTIPLDGWLKALVDEVKAHPEVAVVGSKLLYPDGTIQHAGVAFARDFRVAPYHVYRGLPADVFVVNRRREFQAVTAACMLVRREVFEEVGGFDEGYRNGFEDVDLCLKIREREGCIVYQPASVLYHLESKTPGRHSHETENAERLQTRWGHKRLEDADAIYVADGFALRFREDNGRPISSLERLTTAEAEARWGHVAEVQRLARVGNIAAVQPLLAQADAWPADTAVLRWGAQMCGWAGVPASSEAFWRCLLALEEAPDARAALARLAIETGALDEAETHLKALLAHAPMHGEGWLLKGVLAMQRLEYREAAKAFEAALHHDGDARRARLGLGMAVMGQGQVEQAWERFQAVLAEEPNDAEAIHWLLRAGTALEQWVGLADHLSVFLRLNPGDLAVRFALAGVQVRLGQWEAARQQYDTLCLLNPTFEGLEELAQALEKGGTGVSA